MTESTPATAARHKTNLHYELFSDAYSASCTCGWRVGSCTDRERIVRFKTEHEQESNVEADHRGLPRRSVVTWLRCLFDLHPRRAIVGGRCHLCWRYL